MSTIGVVASQNKHKIEEIEKITEQFSIKLISRDDYGLPKFEIEEDGENFEENSYKKAKEIWEMCQEIVIADDSGLCVDYLDGAPGVYSARFAGEDVTYQDNNDKLLKLLEGVPMDKRTAYFVSVITMILKNGEKIVAEGRCYGHILTEEKGNNGFGYDPIFRPLGYDMTFAELGSEEKNKISHRAKALEKLKEMLKKEFNE